MGQQQHMKIGFFGDSFVEELSNPHSWFHGYQTYLEIIKNHYNAEIVNLGQGGSSYWDVILKQFTPFMNDLPDVCVFCWTESSRLFHPTVRNIGPWLAGNSKHIDPIGKLLNYKKYNAAKQYYMHLHDQQKAEQERLAALYYFDNVVLAPIQEKTKIIHLWSFGNVLKWEQENPYYPSNITYPYRWKTGHEIHPSLNCFTLIGCGNSESALAPNHFGSKENNTTVASILINTINNHKNGSLSKTIL